MPLPQNMTVLHKGYLVTFKKKQVQKSSENPVKGILLKETFPFVRDVSICKGVSLCTRMKRTSKSLETLLNGEGSDLNHFNNLSFLTVHFLETFHNWTPPPPPQSAPFSSPTHQLQHF